jgi:hypothetical protein
MKLPNEENVKIKYEEYIAQLNNKTEILNLENEVKEMRKMYNILIKKYAINEDNN